MTYTRSHPLAFFTAMALLPLGSALLGAGCKDKGGDDSGDGGGGDGGGSQDGGGSGGDGGGGDGGSDCTETVTDTSPGAGETGWYWKDPLQVTLSGATDDVSFRLADSGGAEIPVTATWSEGQLVATLSPGDGMTGMETYTLTTSVCGSTHELVFQTDEFGTPLTDPAESLVGRSYYFDLPGATFVQPVGVGALLGNFLDVPILIGVTAADATEIDVLGAQGMQNGDKEWVQDTDQLTWDFPAADFGSSPFFEADASEIVISYGYGGDIIDIPVYDFHIEGTFSADGSRIGHGKAIGMGDTSNMGPILDLGDEPRALCDFFENKLGLECEDCGDGTMTCVTLEAWFPEAPLLPDVTLVEVTG